MCVECMPNFEFKDDFPNDKNCYPISDGNYYFFDQDNKHHLTEGEICPENYNKLIPEKKRCIDECKNDNLYKYEYQNICYKFCPTGTIQSINDNFRCEEKIGNDEDEEYCQLMTTNLESNNHELSYDEINQLTLEYFEQFGSLDNFVSKKENDNYIIYIYKLSD